jgi:uncharacterized coiled-coil DUF342 family protein
MSETSHENIAQELVNLRKQLGELRNQVENYYNEALDWKAKRDELNKSIGQFVARLKEEREQRKRANEKVAELKVFKQEFNNELEEKKTLIGELEEKKRASLTSIKYDPEYVRQRIKKLEWFVQTNVLSLNRENEVVKEISALEKRLQGSKVVDEIETQLAQVSDQARSIGNKTKEYRNQMLEHVRTSQNHHAAIIELGKKVGDIKKEADCAHKKYLELFDLASQSLSNSKKIQDRIRELTDKMQLENESKKPDKKRDLQEKFEEVAAQAFEKVKKGNRITMDELSVLVKKGYFNESQKSP